jgi:flagellar hook-associated protein 1 FlgK
VIDIGTPAPAANDKFMIRPVASASSTIKRVLDDPLGIAAASPVQATLAATNTGTATVGSLSAADPSIDPNTTVAITFSSDTGSYTYTMTDSASGTVTGSGTGTWTAGEPIELNGFAMALDGVPRSGDKFTVSRTKSSAANNGNALAMVSLRDQSLVGADAAGANGTTITDAYSSALADVGVRVQTAKSTATTSAAVAAQAEATRSADAGVNLDEEAAKLIQFQQSYQAAAKVLAVAQSIFDTLLQAART